AAARFPKRPDELIAAHLASSRYLQRLCAFVQLILAGALELIGGVSVFSGPCRFAALPSARGSGFALGLRLQAALQHFHQVNDLSLAPGFVQRLRRSFHIYAAFELRVD